MKSAVSISSGAPLGLSWASVAALALIRPDPAAMSPGTTLAWLIAIITVIVLAAFGVLGNAEVLARQLGDPYGTLVLTISVTAIEVTLVAAVLFGPGSHETVARDSAMAAMMLFPGLFFGLAALIGTLRHGPLQLNREGLSAYLGMLVVFGALAFVVPGFIGDDGSYTPNQTVVVVLLTAGTYGFFLWQQIGPRAGDFREVGQAGITVPPKQAGRPAAPGLAPAGSPSASAPWLHAVMLFSTALAIVLLSQHMAELLDFTLAPTSAPPELSGLLVALIVLLPEGLTTLRAGWFGEIQRVANLTHGAAVSVVGLTIPAVLAISLITGQRIVFAESDANIALLAILALISTAILGARRVTPVHAVALLVLSTMYLLSIFA